MSTTRTAVCLYVRDEARDIAEWLAFQVAVGFDAVIIYDNASVDATAEIARTFGRTHDVRLHHWPDESELSQSRSYLDCLTTYRRQFDWIAFFDADELLVPRLGDVQALLADRRDASAVVVNWAMFGSAGHRTRPPGLMAETFTRRAKSDFPRCRIVKFIVRPEEVRKVAHPCMFLLDGPCRTPAGKTPAWHGSEGVATVRAEHSVAQLNHYFTRSRAEWMHKAARGFRDGPSKLRTAANFARYDRNEMPDPGALRFMPAVRAILAAADIHPENEGRAAA
jgi:glycosyltransferase involved in cell wall biosynthesis